MPDLATHFIINHAAARSAWLKRYLLFFLWGSILPDVLSRAPSITNEFLGLAMGVFHTPVAILLVCYLIALQFKEAQRTSVFYALALGSLLHCFADAFQRHLGEGYFWLFPFSWQTYSWGLFWPEDPIVALPFLTAGWIILLLIEHRKHAN